MQIELERDHLRQEVREALAFGDIIGKSPPLQAVLRQVERVAPTNASVLILGESGTGKELVAGNVRELAHVIERAVILTDGERLRLDEALILARPRRPNDSPGRVRDSISRLLTDAEMRRLERDNIQQAISRARGKIYGPDGAAALLGIKPTTLAYRMKALRIPRPRA